MIKKLNYSLILVLACTHLHAQTDYFNLNSGQDLDVKTIAKNVMSYFGNSIAGSSYENYVQESTHYETKPLHSYHVVSPSMLPLIPVGSKIYSDENISFDELQVGDIIVYRSKNYDSLSQNIVHRVVKIMPGYILCKGDNNTSIDKEIVTKHNFKGKVVQIKQPIYVASD